MKSKLKMRIERRKYILSIYLHAIISFSHSPLTLLKNSKSSFYEMCQKSGEFDILLELAKAKHNLIDTEF
jgi:hypothetical protein